MLTWLDLLPLGCGSIVGFLLALTGGGGSILATPLLLYVVGLAPHEAVGTSAVAVAGTAFGNLGSHHRAGHVRWRCASLFAIVGAGGALIGSRIGATFDGQKLLFLFALLMLVVAGLMFRRAWQHAPDCAADAWLDECTRFTIPRIVFAALAVGLLAGFFGIGGGFLIVPCLLAATGMPMICAVGSSLLAVGMFGVATAATYAAARLVDWPVASLFLAGGWCGGWTGMRVARAVGQSGKVAPLMVAVCIALAGVFVLVRSKPRFGWM